MGKLAHNGLFCVGSEEVETEAEERTNSDHWVQWFRSTHTEADRAAVRVIYPPALDTDCHYNPSLMNRRMVFRCTCNHRIKDYWVWELSISEKGMESSMLWYQAKVTQLGCWTACDSASPPLIFSFYLKVPQGKWTVRPPWSLCLPTHLISPSTALVYFKSLGEGFLFLFLTPLSWSRKS